MIFFSPESIYKEVYLNIPNFFFIKLVLHSKFSNLKRSINWECAFKIAWRRDQVSIEPYLIANMKNKTKVI